MEIRTFYNLTITAKKIIIDYLANDKTTVTARMNIPATDIKPYMADRTIQEWGTAGTATTYGAFMFDCKWDFPVYRWILPYAYMNLYNGAAKPIFSTIETAIDTLVDSQSEN
jgi:hypothetical protein